MYVLRVHRATSAPDFIQNGDPYLTYHNNVESDISVMGNVQRFYK